MILVPKLSIVIPYSCKNSPQELEETLVSVLENRPGRCQVIVANGGDYQNPYHLSRDEVQFLDLGRERSLVCCINDVLDRVDGPVVNVLSCGTVVEEHWADQPLRIFSDPTVALAMTPVFDRLKSNRLVSSGVLYHHHGVIRNQKLHAEPASGTCLGPHLASAFFRSDLLKRIGGFNPSFCQQISYLDYALILRHLGQKIESVPVSRVHYASKTPIFPTIYERSRQTEQLFLHWSHLNSWYYNMYANFIAVSAEFWGNFPHPRMYAFLFGRVAGLSHYGAHKIKLEDIGRIAEELADEDAFQDGIAIFSNSSARSRSRTSLAQKAA